LKSIAGINLSENQVIRAQNDIWPYLFIAKYQ